MPQHTNNTGMQGWQTLEEFYIDNGNPTGVTESNVPANPNYVVPVSNIDFCPTTPPVPCDDPQVFPGGQSFPSVFMANMGEGTGTVVVDTRTGNIPDKFIGKIDNVVVFDTGYRGNEALQNELNSALADRGLPPEPILDGGQTFAFFEKTSPLVQSLRVEVWAPMQTTAWQVIPRCPTGNPQTLIRVWSVLLEGTYRIAYQIRDVNGIYIDSPTGNSNSGMGPITQVEAIISNTDTINHRVIVSASLYVNLNNPVHQPPNTIYLDEVILPTETRTVPIPIPINDITIRMQSP